MNIIHELWSLFFDKHGRSFDWHGNILSMFYHPYNATWSNERCVEIPIAMRFLDGEKQSDILEVGNVLAHYFPLKHAVVDLFEKGGNVVNEDIEFYRPKNRYKKLISISTIEHIGVDDIKDETKAIRVLKLLPSLADNILRTWLVGYNNDLDNFALSSPCATTLNLHDFSIIVWENISLPENALT